MEVVLSEVSLLTGGFSGIVGVSESIGGVSCVFLVTVKLVAHSPKE